MKLTVTTNHVRRAIDALTPIVNRRSPQAAARCLLLEAGADGTLRLTANNHEVEASYAVGGCTVDVPGSAAVPAAWLEQVVRPLRDAEVRLELADPEVFRRPGPAEDDSKGKNPGPPPEPADHKFIVGAGFLDEFEMPAYHAGKFPRFSADPPAGTVTTTAGDFKRLIERTSYAADRSKQPGRYALGGAKLEVTPDDNVLHAVATDGRRLAHAWAPLEDPAPAGFRQPGSPEGVVPDQALRAALALLEAVAGSDDVRVGWSIQQSGTVRAFFCDSAGFTLRARPLEGRFPAWRGIRPAGEPVLAWEYGHVGRFRDAVRRVAIVMMDDDNEPPAIELEFRGSQLLVWAETELGRAYSRIGLPAAVGSLHLAFRPQYLLDALTYLFGSLPGRFEFRTPQDAVVVSAAGYEAFILPYSPSPESRWTLFDGREPAPVEPRRPPEAAKGKPAAEPAPPPAADPEPDERPKPPPRRRRERPMAPESPARPFAPESPGREAVTT